MASLTERSAAVIIGMRFQAMAARKRGSRGPVAGFSILGSPYPLPDRVTRFSEGLLLTWLPYRHGGGDRGIELWCDVDDPEMHLIGPGWASDTVYRPMQLDVQRAVRWIVGESDGA